MMTDLPEKRSSDAAPFTYICVDALGPFVSKDTKEFKRYDAISTCLASRTIRIEVLNSMDKNSFIMCSRWFIGRRGNMRMLRCDNESNFIGSEKELSKGVLELD